MRNKSVISEARDIRLAIELIEELRPAKQHLDSVATHLRHRHIHLGPNHVLHAVNQVPHRDLFLDPIVDPINVLVVVSGEMQHCFPHGLGGNGAGVDTSSADHRPPLDHGNSLAGLRCLNGRALTRGSGTYHDNVERAHGGSSLIGPATEGFRIRKVTPNAQLIVLSLLAVAVVAIAIWLGLKLRTTPAKREQKRRLLLHQQGRLGDAIVTDADSSLLYYSYSVQGVHYTASQEIEALRDSLPQDLGRVVGSARVKYSLRNPANSIIVCEEWSGIRTQ